MSAESVAFAREMRARIVTVCSQAKAAHVASSLSATDILAVLYAGSANVGPRLVADPERDIVLVSKGHAAAAAYSALAVAGMISDEELMSYGTNGSALGGHVTSSVAGVELSTGSLGHGLPFGLGCALARQRQGRPSRVFVVMSDGECDEGTTWEAALLAGHHGVGALTVMIDRNRIQSLAGTEETVRLEPFASKWAAFGWHVQEVPGHDHDALTEALNEACEDKNRPSVIVCDTVKGRGVSFMEDQVLWHYRPPSEEHLAQALAEIRDSAGGSDA